MHRISSRQDATLKQLQKQARRIEDVSRAEHEILSDLHPSVQKIEKGVDEVSEKIEASDNRS
jgi:predicted  nucleic acid-binding Zn-ribbon protein